MRREEMEILSQPYTHPKGEGRDTRFQVSIGADIPSANQLATEIFNDLSTQSFGISWWASVPVHERILISDYLYQCVSSIETNLAEAKLHYWGFLYSRENENRRLAEGRYTDSNGNPNWKMPTSETPMDDLYKRLEGLHTCGFFQAIGSSLDCLGGAIIGVLALNAPLRWNDLTAAEKALGNIKNPKNPGEQLQADFLQFFRQVKASCGPTDWLEWATQYRNMYIHRGRRTVFSNVAAKDSGIVDSRGNIIPRITSTLHLADYPDKSDMEAMILGPGFLDEDAEITLAGIFKSCRDLGEVICERLISIWSDRRATPSLLEQPVSQWRKDSKDCAFNGYDSTAQPPGFDVFMSHPSLLRRAYAASADDAHHQLWDNTKWSK